jgi:hypothetical protein
MMDAVDCCCLLFFMFLYFLPLAVAAFDVPCYPEHIDRQEGGQQCRHRHRGELGWWRGCCGPRCGGRRGRRFERRVWQQQRRVFVAGWAFFPAKEEEEASELRKEGKERQYRGRRSTGRGRPLKRGGTKRTLIIYAGFVMMIDLRCITTILGDVA